MICEICGTEHDTGIQRFDDNAYQAACRDALKAERDRLREKLQSSVTANVECIRQAQSAEAKLATAYTLLGEALDEEWWPDDAWMRRVSEALAASPAPQKTSETGSTSDGPHGEKQTASQTARASVDVATPSHSPADAPREPGTSPDDADRVAQEFLAPMLDDFCDDDEERSDVIDSLAALLRARDAATWKRACDAIRRENEDALADMLAARGPK